MPGAAKKTAAATADAAEFRRAGAGHIYTRCLDGRGAIFITDARFALEEVEHLVSAIDNGGGLVGGQTAESAVGFGKDQHASQRIVESPFVSLIVDLLLRHRAGVNHRLADQAAVDLLVGRERRLVAQ